MSDPTILDALRKAVALVNALPPLPKRITIHPLDWERLRLRLEPIDRTERLRARLVSGNPFTGIQVIIDCDAELGHPEVEFTDGSTRRLGSDDAA
jgi:hypothetical protein